MSCEPERESDGVGMRAVGVWDFETARPGEEGRVWREHSKSKGEVGSTWLVWVKKQGATDCKLEKLRQKVALPHSSTHLNLIRN